MRWYEQTKNPIFRFRAFSKRTAQYQRLADARMYEHDTDAVWSPSYSMKTGRNNHQNHSIFYAAHRLTTFQMDELSLTEWIPIHQVLWRPFVEFDFLYVDVPPQYAQYSTKSVRRCRFCCDTPPIICRLQWLSNAPIDLVVRAWSNDSYSSPIDHRSVDGIQPICRSPGQPPRAIQRVQWKVLRLASKPTMIENKSVNTMIEAEWLAKQRNKIYLMQTIAPSCHRTVNIKHAVLCAKPHSWCDRWHCRLFQWIWGA